MNHNVPNWCIILFNVYNVKNNTQRTKKYAQWRIISISLKAGPPCLLISITWRILMAKTMLK